jgi:hypothetical protein
MHTSKDLMWRRIWKILQNFWGTKQGPKRARCTLIGNPGGANYYYYWCLSVLNGITRGPEAGRQGMTEESESLEIHRATCRLTVPATVVAITALGVGWLGLVAPIRNGMDSDRFSQVDEENWSEPGRGPGAGSGRGGARSTSTCSCSCSSPLAWECQHPMWSWGRP